MQRRLLEVLLKTHAANEVVDKDIEERRMAERVPLSNFLESVLGGFPHDAKYVCIRVHIYIYISTRTFAHKPLIWMYICVLCVCVHVWGMCRDYHVRSAHGNVWGFCGASVELVLPDLQDCQGLLLEAMATKASAGHAKNGPSRLSTSPESPIWPN